MAKPDQDQVKTLREIVTTSKEILQLLDSIDERRREQNQRTEDSYDGSDSEDTIKRRAYLSHAAETTISENKENEPEWRRHTEITTERESRGVFPKIQDSQQEKNSLSATDSKTQQSNALQSIQPDNAVKAGTKQNGHEPKKTDADNSVKSYSPPELGNKQNDKPNVNESDANTYTPVADKQTHNTPITVAEIQTESVGEIEKSPIESDNLTKAEKAFGQRLRHRTEIPLKQDNRFRFIPEVDGDSENEGSSEEKANSGESSADAVNASEISKENAVHLENNSSKHSDKTCGTDHDSCQRNENDNNGTDNGQVADFDEDKCIVTWKDIKELSDEAILRRLKHLEDIPEWEPKEKDRSLIDMNKWTSVAHTVIRHGQIAKEMHLPGPDLVICLDVSSSMRGLPLKKARHFIQTINTGNLLETETDTHAHIGLVTYGSETKVQHYLTYEHSQIFSKLALVRPGGPSPMYAGLKLCWAVLQASINHQSSDRSLQTIFLISDFIVTPSTFCRGSDTCSSDEATIEQNKVLEYLDHLQQDYNIKIRVVFTGEELNDFAKCIGEKKYGDLMVITNEDLEEEEEVVEEEKEQEKEAVAKPEEETVEKSPEQITVPPFPRPPVIQDLYSRRYRRPVLGDSLEGILSDDEDRGAGVFQVSSDSDSDESSNTSFPVLGTRVKLKADQLLGTVTKCFRNGIRVTWDDSTMLGQETDLTDVDDIDVVTEPRVLKDDEFIKVGCRVKRGSF